MFAVLHLPEFALQAALRADPPAAPGGPAALFSAGGKKSLVLAANAAARAAGVTPGLTAPQAMARCPVLAIRAPAAAAEAETGALLLALAHNLAPRVEDTAPGLCTCDLRGLLDPPEPAARAAVTELAGLGLAATAGLARTPLLARYVAHTLADAAGAAAVRRLAPEAEAAFLAPLTLAVAEPPAELADVCALWGVRTLGDLLALPRDEVGRRFGAAGLALWQRAAGGAPRPLRLAALPVEFAARLRFEDGVATLEPLLFGLRRALDRLALELRAAHFVAAALDLALHLEDGGRHTRTFSLPEPTADPAVLFRALHTHLETLQTAAALTGFDLAVVPARPPVRQAGLFETGLRDPHGFAETLARVSAIVGPGRLGTPQLLDTRRPDAVGLAAPAPTVPPPAPPPVHPPYGLPLRRFRPPLLATLEFAAGSRRPTYLFTHRFHGEIADLRGPWRSSGDWWQHDRAWIRCEWDLALAGGGLYRLLQIDDAYFIEGEYD